MLDNYNWDYITREMSKANGLPEEALMDEKMVERIRAIRLQIQKQKEQAEARQREYVRVSRERAEKEHAARTETLRHEWDQLLTKVPEWKDESTRKADYEKLNGFLAEFGYAPHEVESITDHRQLIIANQARLYRELMKQKDVAAKKVEKLPPKMERPGSRAENSANPSKEAYARLRKTGSLDDAASLLKGLLNN